MAKFNTDTLSLFHTFSKTQVNSDANKPQFSSLGNTVNKSGHTVQSNEIWTEAIPFFGLGVPADFSSTAQVNDLVKDADGVIWQRNATPYNGSTGTYWTQKTKSITSFTKGTDGKYTFTEIDGALVDGSYLLNAAGVPTVKYHAKKQLTPLVSGNNAFIDSEKDASRLQIDGKWVDQFIGVTDVYVNGSAAVSYAPVLFSNSSSTTPLKAGAGEDYLDYCATGIILWDKNECTGNEVISCFEYIGDKLDTALGNIDGKIQDIVETTMEGVVASVGTTTAATNAGISVDSSTKTSPKINISTGTVGGNSDAKLVTGSTVKSYVDSATSQAISNATLAADQKIATTEDTTKLVTVEDVTTYVSPLEQKVNDHLVDAAGKLEITVLADKLPKKPFFEDEVAYVKAYGFEWEKLSNNIYTNKFEVKVAQSVSGLNEFKSHTNGVVLTPSSLAAQTCKLVIYSIDDAKQLTEVAVSQPNTFDTSTSIYAFKFDNQISLSSGVRYRICFQTVDDTNALHCLPVLINSSIQGADVTKNETPTRYIIGETEDDWWGCWNQGAGQLNGVQQVVYGPKVSVSGLTPTPDEDGNTLTGEKGKIYLIPNEGTENQNVYDEFVWTNNTWEKIGTTKVDLTDYVKSVTINGTTYSASAANAGALNLGYVVKSVLWDKDVANNIANSPNSTYGTISNNGTLTLGIASATDSVMGISKMFTGDLPSESSVTDTAVSVKSAAAMYSSLASLASGKVSYVTAGEGDALTGLSLSVGGTITAPIISVTNGVIKRCSLPANTRVVANGLINGTDVIETEKIAFDRDNGDDPVLNFISGESLLTTWVGDMPNLQTGYYLFSNCYNLESFCGDLSSLTEGTCMFNFCRSLESFCGDLSSLTEGTCMFCECSLDKESIGCIADTINEYTGFIEISWNQLPEEDKRQELVDELSRIVDKGWTLRTNQELLPLFDSEKYETGSTTVQPLDLDSEPQTIYYVVKK